MVLALTLKKKQGKILSQLSMLQKEAKVVLMKHFSSSFMHLDHGFTEVPAAFFLHGSAESWLSDVV